jgi:hypothetical protein
MTERSALRRKTRSLAKGFVRRAIGAAAGGTAGLLTGLGLMAILGLGPVVAAAAPRITRLQRSEANSRNPHGWERWLTVALDNQEGGQDTGVVGGATIVACPSAPQLANIHVTLWTV